MLELITDETWITISKEAVIFHTRITMTPMIGKKNNVMEEDNRLNRIEYAKWYSLC